MPLLRLLCGADRAANTLAFQPPLAQQSKVNSLLKKTVFEFSRSGFDSTSRTHTFLELAIDCISSYRFTELSGKFTIGPDSTLFTSLRAIQVEGLTIEELRLLLPNSSFPFANQRSSSHP